MRRATLKPRTLLALATTLAVLAGQATADTYSIYLEDFTDNELTRNIACVRMYVHMDQDDGFYGVNSSGIGPACYGWFPGGSFGFQNGASVWLAVYDPAVNTGAANVMYPLHDGVLMSTDLMTFGTGVSMVTFWLLDDYGDFEANEYPGLVSVADEGDGYIVFRAATVPNASRSWSAVKALYR